MCDILSPETRSPTFSQVRRITTSHTSVHGDTIKARTRDGNPVLIDATEAEQNFLLAKPTVGHALLARGAVDNAGKMYANTVLHAKENPSLWRPDR